jgi:hypothetical protein
LALFVRTLSQKAFGMARAPAGFDQHALSLFARMP